MRHITNMTNTETKQKADTAKRPSRYWRNRWRKRHKSSENGQFVGTDGRRWPPGPDGTALAPFIWPTKEVAEEKALQVIRNNAKPAIYLGPVPCDENGNPL